MTRCLATPFLQAPAAGTRARLWSSGGSWFTRSFVVVRSHFALGPTQGTSSS